MRKRFEIQTELGLIPISEIKFSPKDRHQLTPTLAGLKHIFITPELNEKVFSIIEKKIPTNNINKGREGMNLWEILVLAVCRLTLDADYDEILDLANKHLGIRDMMQVSSNSYYKTYKEFKLQTVKDNLMLLDEETIMEINELVVETAHHLVLKKNEKIQIKSDTYVLETNVHFPTDYNLVLDAGRTCLNIMKKCIILHDFDGWRKLKSYRSQVKNLSRSIGNVSSNNQKDKDNQLQKVVNQYITLANTIKDKIEKSILDNIDIVSKNKKLTDLIEGDLVFFMAMITKHVDLLERRVIKKEIIPSSEKLYSIFETHTEWKSKGKSNKRVELGHNILIATCQHNFILSAKVVENQQDSKLVIELIDKLLLKFKISSISFDKGFWSKENKSLLQTAIPYVIMPKKGKLNLEEKEEEHSNIFKKLRNKHSAVESNINELEQHGLNRCPDKGLHRFKTYTALGVLSYNLKRFGKILLQAKEIKELEEAKQKKAA